jgi:hypothetical protein
MIAAWLVLIGAGWLVAACVLSADGATHTIPFELALTSLPLKSYMAWPSDTLRCIGESHADALLSSVGVATPPPLGGSTEEDDIVDGDVEGLAMGPALEPGCCGRRRRRMPSAGVRGDV